MCRAGPFESTGEYIDTQLSLISLLNCHRASNKPELTVNDILHNQTAVSSAVAFPHSLAEASHPHRTFRESLHDPDSCGRKCKPENMTPTDAVRVNWQHPLLWSQIIQAAAKVGYGMSPIAITTELKCRNSEQFARITPQVIGAWINRSGTCPVWKPEVIKIAQNGNQPPGHVNRTNILAPYPDIIGGIVDQLRKLRQAGIPLNVAQCCAIIVARLYHAVPQVFRVIAKDGSVF
jgi:hypothetical protein